MFIPEHLDNYPIKHADGRHRESSSMLKKIFYISTNYARQTQGATPFLAKSDNGGLCEQEKGKEAYPFTSSTCQLGSLTL